MIIWKKKKRKINTILCYEPSYRSIIHQKDSYELTNDRPTTPEDERFAL